jgi:hypothetical protein
MPFWEAARGVLTLQDGSLITALCGGGVIQTAVESDIRTPLNQPELKA